MTALRVLVVEHDDADVELSVHEMERAGFEVEAAVASTAEELREHLAAGPWDILLSDYQLAGWTGLDAWRILKESGRDVPFILVTGTLGEEAAVECLKQGIADYVLKERIRRLPLAVRRALDEKALRDDRRRTIGALREAEEQYRGIFENAIEGIYQSTLAGRFVTANPMMARILGYASPAELLAVPDVARSYLEPARREEFVRLVDEQGVVAGFESQVRRKDGTPIWISESARALRDEAGRLVGFEGTVIDVTERRGLEAQLRQSQKMDAIGQLAGGVAHDFNNLLMAIAGYGELVLRRLGPSDPARRHVSEILRAADRAASLTRQLLAFGRKQVLEPRVLDLNAVVEDMDKLLRRLIGEHIDVVARLAPDLGAVRADPAHLEQVVLNLALNARDAMPRGGKLTLETANVDLDEEYAARHVGVKPGPHVLLAISDDGIGMDAATLSRIFEPFFTTKEPGKGTGLGLSTVYGIVQQSGGHVWVYSEVGHGTTFKVYLPRAAGTPGLLPRRAAAPPPKGSETILLVEDEEPLRLLLREILEDAGYSVLAATNGAEALSLARTATAAIHLVLSDLAMPQMGGPELFERLRPVRPATRFLCMSGYAEHALAHRNALPEGLPLLQKPITPDTLLRRIRDVLDGPQEPGP